MKNFCSVNLPISSSGHWFFESLGFWTPYIFWFLIPCQIFSWQRFSPVLWAISLVWWLFLLLCRRFLAPYCPICWSFLSIAKVLEFYSRSYSLCLCLPLFL
jgi:hypothetical protein